MKKNECLDCKKKTTNGVYILTGKGWTYEFYCINCARAFLGKVAKMSLLKATITELTQLSRQYDSIFYNNVKNIVASGFSRDDAPVEFKANILRRHP